MWRIKTFFHVWLFLLPLVFSADFESVSIESNLDNAGHTCISKCLYYTLIDDMGSAMGCGNPYDNRCYCATETESASNAGAWMSKCASSCSAGDRSRDLSSMQSHYASYCMAAGFTQPGATRWYNPAEATEEPSSDEDDRVSDSTDAEPSRTVDSGAAETTTQMTIVTQTTEGGAGPSKSRGTVPARLSLSGSAVLTDLLLVIVEATSTYWVDPDGSPANMGSSEDEGSTIKIGVGVAVPVVALFAAGLFAWWFIRRRRQRHAQPPPATQPLSEVTTGGGPAIAPIPERKETLQRKPVGTASVSPLSSFSHTNELSGVGVQRELSGREIHPFPNVTPSPPIVMAGQHEMTGEGRRPDLEMDGRDARVEMSGEGRPPELPGQTRSPPPVYTPAEATQRWELPDNSRGW
ncbi:hypothetical protein FZEAL_5754 [Fusarium zealandicum]|uniref:WSC domain-containing protein n=1 Tax=Fusarium zealandicum TaxID=1053134 RepID=A0A8H4XJI6_9HYPO|nr:hypothetical protein FZEAL_5754 [Fusarium zealandicum]